MVAQLLHVITKLGEQLLAPKVSDKLRAVPTELLEAQITTEDLAYQAVKLANTLKSQCKDQHVVCTPQAVLLPKPKDPGFDIADYTRAEAVSAVSVAIARGDLRMLKMIVNAYQLSVNDYYPYCARSGGEAVKAGHWDVVRYLRKEMGFTIPKTGEEVLHDMKHACTKPSIFGYQ